MTKSINFKILVVVLVLIGLFIWFRGQAGVTPVETPLQVEATDEPQSGGSVSIKNMSFNPATITVKAGTTVTWTNNDTVQHNVRADSVTSKILNPGDQYSYIFAVPGTYDYICPLHPQMTGQIIVE